MEIKIHCSYSKLVPIDEIRLNPKNRNTHSKEQIERFCKIVQAVGVRHPVIISLRSGICVAGEGRILTFRKLGMKEVPVDYQDFESEEQEFQFAISDNAIAEWAQLDFSGINKDITELGPFDIELLGIKDFTIEPLDKLAPGCDEDDAPDAPKETIIKRGDLIELGSHRLLCGDSTVITEVEKLMNGEKADMVFTDPPYGISFNNTSLPRKDFSGVRNGLKTNEYKNIKNDDVELNMREILSPFNYVKEIFVWGANNFVNVLPVSTWFCWDRKLNESADKNLCGDFDLCWSKEKHKMKMYRVPWYGVFGHSKKDDGEKKVHPTMKPVKLIELFLTDYSNDSELVVDLFGGSGSTLIACEKTNRKCFMMELDEHYCDVIISRWCKYTNTVNVKVNGVDVVWERKD